jgi:acetolactate synthase regulatory subunit
MRHLAVETNGQPDTLVRVLTLLRRRRCRIVAVDYREADRHGPGRLLLSVDAPTRLGHCVEAWLMGLVDVVEVCEPARPNSRPPARKNASRPMVDQMV